MRSSDKAWIAMGVGVISYDALCPDGQTLSEGADAYMERHPWVTRGLAAALALHVCNALPMRLDLIHWLFVLSRKWRRP